MHEIHDSLAKRILVAIPVLNEADHIESCLRSLLDGDPALRLIQCMVLDGGSTDGTAGIVQSMTRKFPNITVVDNQKRLQSAAVNLAAQLGDAERDILIRCDAHAQYPPDYILNVAASLEQKEVDSLVVPMDAIGESCFQKANAWIVDTPLGSGGSAHRGGMKSGFVDHGHHAGFRREQFLFVGGYDETFSHNEDAEYDARLVKKSGRIYLDADIRVGYYPRDNIAGLWRQYWGYGSGRARNVLKNKLRPRLRQLIPVCNVIFLLASLAFLPVHPWAAFWPALYLGLLTLVTILLPIGKKSLCGIWGGTALATMHLAWGLGFLSSFSLFWIRKSI